MSWKYILHRTFGGVKRLPRASAQIKRGLGESSGRSRLGISMNCLQALFSSEAPMLIFKKALPSVLCHDIASKLEALAGGSHSDSTTSVAARFVEWRLGGDPEAPVSDYTKLGYTKTDVLREENIRMMAGRAAPERYLKLADDTRQFLEEYIFGPHHCPMSAIMAELNELDGISCHEERCPVSKKPFLPYVIRRMAPGGRPQHGNIHMDSLIPGSTFSVNVYLQVPAEDAGGELVLYPVKKDGFSRFVNEHFFATIDMQNFFPDRTFYAEEFLASGEIEPIVHTPEVGDVVVFDPAYPHAVRDFEASPGQHRISMQTFVQLSRKNGHRLLEYAI